MKRTLKVQLIEGNDVLIDLSLPTTLEAADLLQRLPTFLAEPLATPAGSISARDAEAIRAVGKTYAPLATHLASIPSTTLTATFSYTEIEDILGDALPATARGKHARSWWANTETHSQGKAWLAIGWKTANVNPEAETVEFRRK